VEVTRIEILVFENFLLDIEGNCFIFWIQWMTNLNFWLWNFSSLRKKERQNNLCYLYVSLF